jgi:hypothetical protein
MTIKSGIYFAFLFFITGSLADPVTPVRLLGNGSVLLEDFQSDIPGDLPANWFNRNGDRNPISYTGALRQEYQYAVRSENGRHFLRYEGSQAKHLLLPLGANEEIDLRKTPILSWQWRIHNIPEGAREDNDTINDSAASVYVVWGFNMLRIPRVIRYTWSSTLAKGTEFTNNMNMQKVIVLGSGTQNQGQWQTFERNIVEDYETHFRGRAPRRPVAILILSDADNTGSFSKADYDMFMLNPKP